MKTFRVCLQAPQEPVDLTATEEKEEEVTTEPIATEPVEETKPKKGQCSIERL